MRSIVCLAMVLAVTLDSGSADCVTVGDIGVVVKCTGAHITTIPIEQIPRNVTDLTIHNTSLVSIEPNKSSGIASKFSHFTDLATLKFTANGLLERIEAGAFHFHSKTSLRNILIQSSKRLQYVSRGAFSQIAHLETLSIMSCGLKRVPDLSMFNNERKALDDMDLTGNQITSIKSGDFDLYVDIGAVLLNGNPLARIGPDAFAAESRTDKKYYITSLSIRDCKALREIDQNAFRGSKVVNLDLSGSSIERLPVNGLQELEKLVLENILSLKVFPSVMNFKSLRSAYLTYHHHCCAFKYPSIHERQDYVDAAQEIKKCNTTSSLQTTTPLPRDETLAASVTRQRSKRKSVRHSKRKGQSRLNGATGSRKQRSFFGELKSIWEPGEISQPFEPPLTNNTFDDPKWDFDYGTDVDNVLPVDDPDGIWGPDESWHTSTLDPNSTHNTNQFCGDIVKQLENVHCVPQPDMFNPCEDLMGFMWLRVIVWVVVLTALVGNTLVLIVTMSSKHKLSVSKFLMCNLAFADWIISMYLLLLAVFDLMTMGAYFTRAIPWQYDGGCQAAGFMAVFATCLSIFTLTMITLERWYAIRYAINLNKRLRLRQATTTMMLGWLFALLMASLPLFNISSYSKTSVCLPMKVENAGDLAYVVILLLFNIAGFVMICFCYVDMYRQVSGDGHAYSNASRNDANIAKRMAILVFTDFACLAPIAFFGLTAAGGSPFIDVTDSKILLVFFFPLNSCANPFLYAIFTKQFKKDLRGMVERCGFRERRGHRYKPGQTSYPPSWSLHSRTSHTAHHQLHRPSATTINTTYLTELTHKNSKSSLSHINNSPKITPTTSPKLAKKSSPKLASNGNKNGPVPDAMTSRTLERASREARKLSVVPETSQNSEESSTADPTTNIAMVTLNKSNSNQDATATPPHRKTVRSASQYEENSLQRRVAADYEARNSSDWRKYSQGTTLTNLSSVTEASYSTEASFLSDDTLCYPGKKRGSDSDTLVAEDGRIGNESCEEKQPSCEETGEPYLTLQKVKSWNENARISKMRGDSGLGEEDLSEKEPVESTCRSALLSDSSSQGYNSIPRQSQQEDDVFDVKNGGKTAANYNENNELETDSQDEERLVEVLT